MPERWVKLRFLLRLPAFFVGPWVEDPPEWVPFLWHDVARTSWRLFRGWWLFDAPERNDVSGVLNDRLEMRRLREAHVPLVDASGELPEFFRSPLRYHGDGLGGPMDVAMTYQSGPVRRRHVRRRPNTTA